MNTTNENNNDTETNKSTVVPRPPVKVNDIKEDFIIGNVDSKTKGFERFADCFDKSFGPNKNPIKIAIIENKTFRI